MQNEIQPIEKFMCATLLRSHSTTLQEVMFIEIFLQMANNNPKCLRRWKEKKIQFLNFIYTKSLPLHKN